ncbi:hypothetical protein WAX74_07055 [Psychrobacillus sp. FJAT-51614]|uniref:Prepilin-type N-terminal cleavage/methylation domain-containing protein n=1 Tax=Psychrobacillus mangrovi TaxID=3117745 RepID=A0ABU8F315_9BACI
MKKKLSNQEAGFTLIEIIASVLLLTVVITLFITLIPQMFNMNIRTEENLSAVSIGKKVLADIKENKYDSEITQLKNSSAIDTNLTITSYNPYKVVVTFSPTPDVEGSIQTLYPLKISIEDSSGKQLTTTYGYSD